MQRYSQRFRDDRFALTIPAAPDSIPVLELPVIEASTARDFAGCPILRVFVSGEGWGFRQTVATTVPLNRAKGSASPPNISVRLFSCAFMQNLIASQRIIKNRRK